MRCAHVFFFSSFHGSFIEIVSNENVVYERNWYEIYYMNSSQAHRRCADERWKMKNNNNKKLHFFLQLENLLCIFKDAYQVEL